MADFDKIFLSTLSLRRATAVPDLGKGNVRISIHALLAESDKSAANSGPCIRYFYPRSPCGERLNIFYNPTHSIVISIHALLAESDAAIGKPTLEIAYFYPRSPCGERRHQPQKRDLPT